MSEKHFVAPAPRTPELRDIEGSSVDVSGIWSPSAHVAETGTPLHRALATVVRSAPIMVLMAVVAAPIAWFLQSGWMLGLAIVGCCALAGYLAVLYLDLMHNSPGSTERHRINAATSIKRLELVQKHELRRTIVEAYLRSLGGGGQ